VGPDKITLEDLRDVSLIAGEDMNREQGPIFQVSATYYTADALL
jgi:hypothetical protein